MGRENRGRPASTSPAGVLEERRFPWVRVYYAARPRAADRANFWRRPPAFAF
jgi:hypothetical protein